MPKRPSTALTNPSLVIPSSFRRPCQPSDQSSCHRLYCTLSERLQRLAVKFRCATLPDSSTPTADVSSFSAPQRFSHLPWDKQIQAFQDEIENTTYPSRVDALNAIQEFKHLLASALIADQQISVYLPLTELRLCFTLGYKLRDSSAQQLTVRYNSL